MSIYYDEEGDFLEITLNGYTDGYYKDIDEGIAERIDEKTGRITGVAIMSFRKRTQKPNELKLVLPMKITLAPSKL